MRCKGFVKIFCATIKQANRFALFIEGRKAILNILLYERGIDSKSFENMFLSLKGIHNIEVFESIIPAKKYIAKNSVDMIFLDTDDETVDWRFVYNSFKSINNKTEIVLLSSYINQAVRAYEIGAFDYLIKPVKKVQLERVLSKMD